jgi:hypothetical protein
MSSRSILRNITGRRVPMSSHRSIGRLTVAVIVAGSMAVVGFDVVAATDHSAISTFNGRSLHTTDGVTIHQNFNKSDGTVSVFTSSSSGRTPLNDGVYKINNGGSIRVKGGKIVWDSFGVVSRLSAGDDQALGAVPA